MSAKNTRTERALTLCGTLSRCCAGVLPLLCLVTDLRGAQESASLRSEERSVTSTSEEREAPLAQGRRVFDSTVRLRLDALLAPSALELGQRECAAANAKEPLRGRLDRAVVLAANEQLTLPMGAASVLNVAGQAYLFCLEPHYHPPGGGVMPEGWHKGVTVYHAQTPKERRGSLGADPT